MPLEAAARAPDFLLPSDSGRVSLAGAAANATAGAAIVTFFKTTCPTCAMVMPLMAGLERHLRGAVACIAVAEDPLPQATAWLGAAAYGGTVASDAYRGHAAARRFRIRALPTMFLVDATMHVALTMEGWERAVYNRLAVHASELAARPRPPLSTPGDSRPERQAGCWARARSRSR